MKTLAAFLCVLSLLTSIAPSKASSMLPMSSGELLQASDAVFRGKVVGLLSFKGVDGLIYTRTALRVEEVFKGKFPEILEVVHRGGQLGNEDEYCGLSPKFEPGADYLLFVVRGPTGKLQSIQGQLSAIFLESSASQQTSLSGDAVAYGQAMLDAVRTAAKEGVIAGADVRDQWGSSGPLPLATTGMLGATNSRFLQPDRGEPIPYLIDADSLPSGITLAQATNAVQQALNAWTAVTSLRFTLEGIQSFGQGADTVTSNDEKLRIQLHDNYNRINTAGTLGVGGRSTTTSPVGPGWDLGGNVAGNEFRKTTRGYVVLESTATSMQTLSTFTEVLCHEIGHALNMAHSSEVPTTDPVLLNAIMYFQAHADGRGAALGVYDPPVIQQAYPANTPPFSFRRFLDVTTAPSTPNVAGINEVEMRGYDLQGSGLSMDTAGATSMNGTFSVLGNNIQFTPAGWFLDGARLSPAGNSFNDVLYVRFSDGTNASPYSSVRVISLTSDSDDPSDGIPDYWMNAYFGHAAPQSGDKSRAGDDADGDGLTNIQEYLAGSNPRDAASAQRITSFDASALRFQAKAYDAYELLGSTDLTNWNRIGNPIVPTTTDNSILVGLPQTNITAVISNLPMSGSRMFFRVVKIP